MSGSPRFALGAFGSLWVSNFVEGSVSRIDPAAGRVIATIDVASGPQLMLAGSEGVWVSNTDGPAVQRIDPQTNTISATLEDAGTTPDGLVELAGAVWVASDSGPQLHRIDPTSGTVHGPWPVADQGTISANQLLVAVDGTFWIPLFNQNEVVQVEPPVASA
jgi:streptogramin lyase